jgi:histidinol-phosphate phosphatase family protein
MGKKNSKLSAVFIDRDGTIIFNKKYLNSIKQIELYPFVIDSIKKLNDAGFVVIIVTNQSGISRGMFTENDLEFINKKIIKLIEEKGAKIDDICYCPHADFDKCNCRKPKIGMIEKCVKKFCIDLKKSYAIGDTFRDYFFGLNMGGSGILVLTGHGVKEYNKMKEIGIKPIVCKTLKSAVDRIIKNNKM